MNENILILSFFSILLLGLISLATYRATSARATNSLFDDFGIKHQHACFAID